MKNILILGAGGNIARSVIDILVKKDDIYLTLFMRNASRLGNTDVSLRPPGLPMPMKWTMN